MKRLFCLLILCSLIITCNKGKDITGGDEGDITESQLNIQVDPRMELLAVIQHFTDWADKRHTQFNFTYKEDLDTYFKNYSTHSAVQKSEQLTNSGFSYDAPAAFVLYHNNPPSFRQMIPYSSYLKTRAGSETSLKDFADKISDFAKKTGFMDFYNSNLNLYNQIQNEIQNEINDTNYIKILEDFYGERKNSYNIIPAPLFHSGGYGHQIESALGGDVYNICGPVSVKDDKPYFGDKNRLMSILLHEFSHSFVNPVTDKYITEIHESESLFGPIKDKMEQQAYNNWKTCVNEHLIRINVIIFVVQLIDENIKNFVIQKEVNNGFIYITHLDTLMEKYMNNRKIYDTYESFYPEIIDMFNSLVK
jgi:hypothetical protein